jgi:hypothetical protein
LIDKLENTKKNRSTITPGMQTKDNSAKECSSKSRRAGNYPDIAGRARPIERISIRRSWPTNDNDS